MQKGYGKSAEEMIKLDEAFQYKLGRFALAEVLEAFNEYTDEHSDIPAPADIIQLIDPAPEPLSNAMYVKLCKKREGNPYIPKEETRYIRIYEQVELQKAETWVEK